jgi:hypothetical protein
MVKLVRLERRNFEMRIETWLDADAQGAWHSSPDVTYSFDKKEHDRIWFLCTSAASAFITWLRARGQEHDAAEVQWRFEHAAPIPPFKPGAPTSVVALPGQMGLFEAM